LSDYTIDNTTVITSIALDALIIEKNVTLDRNGGGANDSFSLKEKELKELCTGTKTAWNAFGQVYYGRKSSEQNNIKFRRSLYFIKKGEVIADSHIRSIRPRFGLPPKYYDRIIGRVSSKDVERGRPVDWTLFGE
jgi:N-acetylneuraminate synthase